jgi:hypothetical protein
MDNTRKELKIFGFGLALIIAFLVLKGQAGPQVSFIVFVLSIGAILFLIAKLFTHGWAYHLVYWGFCATIAQNILSNGVTGGRPAWLGVSTSLYLIAFVKPELLKGVYGVWMRIGHKIGGLIMLAALSLVFFLVFFPVSLILKMMKKDFLDRAIDPDATSYWHLRPQGSSDAGRYKNQF